MPLRAANGNKLAANSSIKVVCSLFHTRHYYCCTRYLLLHWFKYMKYSINPSRSITAAIANQTAESCRRVVTPRYTTATELYLNDKAYIIAYMYYYTNLAGHVLPV